MKEFKFKFIGGFYTIQVETDDELKIQKLTTLADIQEDLLEMLPKRANEINNFIIASVNDICFLFPK